MVVWGLAALAVGPEKSSILIVEDDVLLRSAVGDFLRTEGFRLVEALNANEAMAYMAAKPVDLVLVDGNLPGSINGIGLADWIDRHFPDVPIIIMSGDPWFRYARRSRHRFLQKPFELPVLADAIRALLDAKRGGLGSR